MLVPMFRSSLIATALASVLCGCGATTTDGPAPTDSAVADSGGSDTKVVDSAAADTALVDSAMAETSSDAAGTTCGDKTCVAGEICTRTYTTGGACFSCDSDPTCGAGRHCSGGCCVADTPSYGYACKSLPSGCASSLACGGTCGPAVCSGGCPCESVSGTTVTCHCLAP